MGRVTTKIDEDVLERVREYSQKNGHTVVGFINMACTNTLNELIFTQKVRSQYVSKMGDYLIKESNKKKK